MGSCPKSRTPALTTRVSFPMARAVTPPIVVAMIDLAISLRQEHASHDQ
jgi:hypothetical protein